MTARLGGATIVIMAPLPFLKVEGLGNDFLLLDRLDRVPGAVAREIERLREVAPQVCDRRRGVGADGLLIVCGASAPGQDATMIVVNHDGSRPEMCGNGLRCVAQFVCERTGNTAPRIDTDAGVKRCAVEPLATDEAAAKVLVDMGPFASLGTGTPTASPDRTFTGVSMGNPHAVHFVDGDEDLEALARSLGPDIEVDALYPERTNVEFARVRGHEIELWVWERGCGITQACGTGACATVVAAVEAGLVASNESVTVALPGGLLEIRVRDDGHVDMRGPSRRAFHGVIEV